MQKADNWEKLKPLVTGNWQEVADSEDEAVRKAIFHFGWWSGFDVDTTCELFRRSALSNDWLDHDDVFLSMLQEAKEVQDSSYDPDYSSD